MSVKKKQPFCLITFLKVVQTPTNLSPRSRRRFRRAH